MEWGLLIVINLSDTGTVGNEIVNTRRFWVHPLTQRRLKICTIKNDPLREKCKNLGFASIDDSDGC